MNLKKHSEKIVLAIIVIVVTALFNFGGRTLSMPYDNKRDIKSNTESLVRIENNVESKLTVGEFERMFEEHRRGEDAWKEYVVRDMAEMKILMQRNHSPLTARERARVDEIVKENGFHPETDSIN